MRRIRRVLKQVACASALLLIPLPLSRLPVQSKEQVQSSSSVLSQSATTTTPAPATPVEKAWSILRAAAAEGSADRRAKAVSALGLLTGNPDAEKLVRAALKDKAPEVRKAAAGALGRMGAADAKDDLRKALDDAEPAVALAAANALLSLKDNEGYSVYYEVLTGRRKGGKGLVQGELDTLKDKKKIAQMGFEEGIGFVPFASIGYEVFRTVTKYDTSPVRAAAARKLATDPDPASGQALVDAAGDKNWLIRAAALETLSLRGDASLLPKIVPRLDDSKEEVRLTAAACVIRLSGLPAKAAPPRRS